jgi:hypothetical protein
MNMAWTDQRTLWAKYRRLIHRKIGQRIFGHKYLGVVNGKYYCKQCLGPDDIGFLFDDPVRGR